MKINIHTLIAAAAMSIAVNAMAAPAITTSYTVTQPDGTTLTIHKIGDETLHFTLTDDNMLLVEDDNGQFSYGRIDSDGNVVSTQIKAYDSAVRPASHTNFLTSIEDVDFEAVSKKSSVSNAKRAARRTKDYESYGRLKSSFPVTGEIRGVVLLVEFSDVSFKTSYSGGVNQHFTDMLNEEGYSKYSGTGSAKDYFQDQSMGVFQPTFDVYGPYTLPHEMAYYGENVTSSGDDYVYRLLIDAAAVADSDVDFSKYDYDGDGKVDMVYIFYAGKGENDGGAKNSVWPHQFTLTEWGQNTIVRDGMQIDRYACSNETASSGSPAGVGTFVHEFTHVLGLPDLYDVTYTHSSSPSKWSVLDSGCYQNSSRTPVGYSTYERNALGWIDLNEFQGTSTYTLESLSETNSAYVVKTTQDREFFLLENRQQTGWDAYLPGHGLVIWHVDATNQSKFENNTPNVTESHQCVTIVKANEKESSSYQSGWAWPGTSGKTEFTSSTTPAFKDWNNVVVDAALTDITEEDNGDITMRVETSLKVPTPHESDAIEKGADYFYASWDEVKGASDYKLWVYSVEKTNAQVARARVAADRTTEVADMGSSTIAKLPDGWSKSSGFSSSTEAYGKASPSMKNTKDGAYIDTPTYTDDVVEISIWSKALDTSSNYITVKGLINDEYVTLGTIDATTDATTTVLDDLEAGIKQVRFEFARVGGGNLCVDDITITTSPGDVYTVLPDYDGVLTNGNTSMRVDQLKDGCDTYCFVVAATDDGENFTEESRKVMVYLGETGVGNISADRYDNVSVAVNDRTLSISGADGDRVDVFGITGRHLQSQRLCGGSATLTLPASGMYIVRVGASNVKVVVR